MLSLHIVMLIMLLIQARIFGLGIQNPWFKLENLKIHSPIITVEVVIFVGDLGSLRLGSSGRCLLKSARKEIFPSLWAWQGPAAPIEDSPQVTIVAMISPFSLVAGTCLQISHSWLPSAMKCTAACDSQFFLISPQLCALKMMCHWGLIFCLCLLVSRNVPLLLKACACCPTSNCLLNLSKLTATTPSHGQTQPSSSWTWTWTSETRWDTRHETELETGQCQCSETPDMLRINIVSHLHLRTTYHPI